MSEIRCMRNLVRDSVSFRVSGLTHLAQIQEVLTVLTQSRRLAFLWWDTNPEERLRIANDQIEFVQAFYVDILVE